MASHQPTVRAALVEEPLKGGSGAPLVRGRGAAPLQGRHGRRGLRLRQIVCHRLHPLRRGRQRLDRRRRADRLAVAGRVIKIYFVWRITNEIY